MCFPWTGARSFSGPSQCIRSLFEVGGVRGLFHGVTITVLREVPALTIYMTSYTSMRRLFTPDGQRHPSIGLDLVAGGTAGIASWITTIPIDVVKTRIQSEDLANRRYSGGIRHCFASSWKADGARVFCRGLSATCLRAFPTNAVTLVIYSKALAFFKASSAAPSTTAASGVHRDGSGSRSQTHKRNSGLDKTSAATMNVLSAAIIAQTAD
jgi:Mitochondrial carrier protein